MYEHVENGDSGVQIVLVSATRRRRHPGGASHTGQQPPSDALHLADIEEIHLGEQSFEGRAGASRHPAIQDHGRDGGAVRTLRAACGAGPAGGRERRRTAGDHCHRHPARADGGSRSVQPHGGEHGPAQPERRDRHHVPLEYGARPLDLRHGREAGGGRHSHHPRHQRHRRAAARLSHVRAESGRVPTSAIRPSTATSSSTTSSRSRCCAGRRARSTAPVRSAAHCVSSRTRPIRAPLPHRSRRAAIACTTRAARATTSRAWSTCRSRTLSPFEHRPSTSTIRAGSAFTDYSSAPTADLPASRNWPIRPIPPAAPASSRAGTTGTGPRRSPGASPLCGSRPTPSAPPWP